MGTSMHPHEDNFWIVYTGTFCMCSMYVFHIHVYVRDVLVYFCTMRMYFYIS